MEACRRTPFALLPLRVSQAHLLRYVTDVVATHKAIRTRAIVYLQQGRAVRLSRRDGTFGAAAAIQITVKGEVLMQRFYN